MLYIYEYRPKLLVKGILHRYYDLFGHLVILKHSSYWDGRGLVVTILSFNPVEMCSYPYEIELKSEWRCKTFLK